MLKNFIDADGRIKQWPSKNNLKIEVIKYIASKFEVNRTYTEKEVNEIIMKWHTYNDYFMIRRGMIEYQLLERTRNGSKYWKVEMEGEI
ncbi:MAG: DUF2087 domain-containing protein [Clostridiales bacterium]|nr:DUF2087 domain-containing protein [Clostridiales bacterium]